MVSNWTVASDFTLFEFEIDLILIIFQNNKALTLTWLYFTFIQKLFYSNFLGLHFYFLKISVSTFDYKFNKIYYCIEHGRDNIISVHSAEAFFSEKINSNFYDFLSENWDNFKIYCRYFLVFCSRYFLRWDILLFLG